MNWQDQGRQYHMWFGHGTADRLSDSELRARAFAIVHLAAEQLGDMGDVLPLSLRKTLAILRPLAARAARDANVPPNEFRTRFLGQSFDPVDAWAIQRVMRNVLSARTHGELIDAGHELAGTITSYGEGGWARLMADAAAAQPATDEPLKAAPRPPASPTPVRAAAPQPPQPFLPGPYSADREGFHDYTEGPTTVCPTPCGCTKAIMADALSRFAVPGQDPNAPVVNKGIYPVTIPGTPIPVGRVQTTVSDDGLTVRNVTLPLHIFYDGQVVRSVDKAPDGSWRVTTHGTGNNRLLGGGTLNQETGPWVFEKVDKAMSEYLDQHACAGR